MRRFECTGDGHAKFWAAEVLGVSLTTQWGKLGTAGQSKTKDFASAAAAESELAKLIKEKVGKGYVEVGELAPVGPAKAARPTKAKAAPPAPPLPGVELRTLKSLATKLAKLEDTYRIRTAVSKAIEERQLGDEAVWYAVIHGLVDPAANEALISFLKEADVLIEGPHAEAVARLLTRRPDRDEDGRAGWLPGWSPDLDALVYASLKVAPAAFAERASEYGQQVQVGLAFVRRRLGETVDAALAAKVLQGLANGQATGYGISGNGGLPLVDEAGADSEYRVEDLAGLRSLALRFGSAADWDAALATAVKKNQWGLIENVESALVQLPLADLSEILATRGQRRIFSDSSNALETMLAIMDARGDEPEALFARPKHLPEDEDDAARVRELYAITAARRLGAAGKPVPEAFDEAFKTFKLIRDDYVTAAALEALRAVPRERVLAMVTKALPGAWDKAPLAALGAHFDSAILDAALAEGTYIVEEVLGAIGAPAVPALARAASEVADDAVRLSRYEAMLLAMARGVAAGVVPGDAFEIGVIDGKLVKDFRPGSRTGEALAKVLAALPAARRDAMLLSALALAPQIAAAYVQLGSDAVVDEAVRSMLASRKMSRAFVDALGPRVMGPLVRHIGECQGDAEVMDTLERALSEPDYARVAAALGGAKESKEDALARVVLAAQAVAPTGKRQRVYLVEAAEGERTPREGSLSCVGGAPPGLAKDAIPTDDDGEPLEHLMTVDLDDVPELRSRYEGARAIAFFCPEPGTGERNEETVIVPIPAAAAQEAKLDPGSQPLVIRGVDAPAEVFAKGERAAPIDALRKAIGSAGAHIFGKPFWIQQFDGDDDGLLIQINDGLVPDLNLGDVGSLYVFEGGDAVFFQCH